MSDECAWIGILLVEESRLWGRDDKDESANN